MIFQKVIGFFVGTVTHHSDFTDIVPTIRCQTVIFKMQELRLIGEELHEVPIQWEGHIGRLRCRKSCWQPIRGITLRRCYDCKNYAGRTKKVVFCVLKVKE